MNSANNKRFSHSQFGAHPPYPGFSAEILTKHLQLHLLCPAVVDSKMVLGELLGLANLSKAQALGIHEATKVVVICEDEHFVLASFQIVTPYFENFNNS